MGTTETKGWATRLVSSGLMVKGASDIGEGAAGGGDTSEMKDAMDVAQNPTKLAIAVANGGNMKQANDLGNVVGGAGAIRSLAKNPRSAVGVAMAAKDTYEGVKSAASLAVGGVAAYRNIVTPPPSPRAPAAPDIF